jgi:hypothetical protein
MAPMKVFGQEADDGELEGDPRGALLLAAPPTPSAEYVVGYDLGQVLAPDGLEKFFHGPAVGTTGLFCD